MFEIEKKFILTDSQKEKLLENAEFLGEKTFVDVYYDTAEYALTKNDIWLRARDGQFELKIPMQKNGKGLMNQYNEIEGEEKIRQVFGIVPVGSFLQDIESFNYAPFCELKTVRKKYKKGNFNIDLDEVSFEDFNYSLAEIEIMVLDEKNIPAANDEILKFAESIGLIRRSPAGEGRENIRGKVVEYLFHKKPEHYKALVEEGVVVE